MAGSLYKEKMRDQLEKNSDKFTPSEINAITKSMLKLSTINKDIPTK